MNTNSKPIIISWHRQIFSAICLSVFLFVTAVFAQPPPFRANGKIAFTSNRDGNLEIYVMNNDGTNQVRFTNNPSIDDHPAFSPDGSKIAYISQNDSGGFSIKLMNADGTNQTHLTSIVHENYPYPWHGKDSLSWSPDGRKIAFEENGDIFSINVDGTNRINLTNHPAVDGEPSWSPDGSRIIFISSRVFYLTMHTMKPDGSNVRALPTNGEYWDSSPDWSPNGDKIAFVSHHEESTPIINTANADGTNRRLFDYGCFTPPGCSEHLNKPKWSPDGTKLVFHSWEYISNNAEIYVKNVDGSGFTKLTNTAGSNFNPSWQPIVSAQLSRTIADFDGDGKADISIFRPSDGTWYLNRSTQNFSATRFGLSTDKITPADFDGDGRTDIAVFRDGVWYLLRSTHGFVAVQFGLANDIPQPADFDGDGRADLAVYRGGNWFTLNLQNNQFNAVQFGISTDKPVVNDFDGDGRADFAVYRDGTWYLLQSTQGFAAIQFGLPTDKLVPADYDGDGKIDVAVYRDGIWYLLQSSQGFTAFQFGLDKDIPAPADYDGDGRADAGVFREGNWYLRQSTNGFSAQQFGLANDMPIPAVY